MSDSTETASCTQCRVSSSLTSAFLKVGWGKKQELLCPYCTREENHRHFQMRLINFAALLMLGVLVTAVGASSTLGWFLLNLSFFTALSWLMILPHEAGHAFAAQLVGLGVDRIVVGVGPKVGGITMFGVPIEFHLYPASGVTRIAVRDVPHMRLKWALIVVAGPLVNLLFLGAALEGGEALWRAERIFHGFAPVSVIIAANFLILVGNLWPSSVATDAGRTPNDGYQLLGLARGQPYDFAAYARAGDLARLHTLFEKQRWTEIEAQAARLLLKTPDDYAVQVTLSAALINLGNLDAARQLLERLVERTPPPQLEWQSAVVANNLAWAYLLLDDETLAERAQSLSAKAYALLPWEPFITSTHACTQALYGDAQEVERLLKTRRVQNNRDKTRASSLAGLAVAYARLGRSDEANATLMAARAIDPKAQLVEIAERRVSRAGVEGE